MIVVIRLTVNHHVWKNHSHYIPSKTVKYLVKYLASYELIAQIDIKSV